MREIDELSDRIKTLSLQISSLGLCELQTELINERKSLSQRLNRLVKDRQAARLAAENPAKGFNDWNALQQHNSQQRSKAQLKAEIAEIEQRRKENLIEECRALGGLPMLKK